MRLLMEAEAVSPDVQARGGDNDTSLVRLQDEVPHSRRRGASAQRGCAHSMGGGQAIVTVSALGKRHPSPAAFFFPLQA